MLSTYINMFTASYDTIPLLMEKRKECHDLCQDYADKFNQEGVDVFITVASLFPAPRKVTASRVEEKVQSYINKTSTYRHNNL